MAKRQAGARGRAPSYPRWSKAEFRVVDRFARAIARGRYPDVKSALPECRHGLADVAPGLERTDVAVAWKLLCRAYDFGLERWKHFWTEQELRLLERHASALARGECPDSATAVRRVKRAFEQAGLGARHSHKVIRDRVAARARSLGLAPSTVHLSPEGARVIDRFARALLRSEYPYGMAAAADCRRALVRAGITCPKTDGAIGNRINARARALGWVPVHAPWSASGVRIIDRFARAVVSGEYPSISAAARDCLYALERAGQLGDRTLAGLRSKLRIQVLGMGRPGSKPRWSSEEFRILDRFARAVIRGAYPTVTAGAARCGHALERAGLLAHMRGQAVESKLRERVLALRPHLA